MQIEIKNRGTFASALVTLDEGEEFVSEAGSMFRASANLDIDVTTRSHGKGGILAGVKRWLAQQSFFFSTYRVEGGGKGELGLAPTHQGEIQSLELDGSAAWYCTGGSFLGATSSLRIDTEFQGMKGLFSGESLSFLRLEGAGTMLVSAFGRMAEVDVSDELVVDTGHVVAFDENLEYSISKAGTSWMHSFFGGEGLVMRFKRKAGAESAGRLIVQSHNPKDLGPQLGALLPHK